MTGPDFAAHRKRLRWTQAETAEALGISATTVASFERGRSPVHGSSARLFALYRPGDTPGRPSGPPPATLAAWLGERPTWD